MPTCWHVGLIERYLVNVIAVDAAIDGLMLCYDVDEPSVWYGLTKTKSRLPDIHVPSDVYCSHYALYENTTTS